MFQVHGYIDVVPPLAWSEVKAAGFMVADAEGVPQVPAGQWVRLVATETLVDRPEGVLHRFTFDRLEAKEVEVPADQREIMRSQVAAIVAAFPANVFGGVSRVIRFRGEDIDDVWRIRLAADGTVQRQVAEITWVAPV